MWLSWPNEDAIPLYHFRAGEAEEAYGMSLEEWKKRERALNAPISWLISFFFVPSRLGVKDMATNADI